MTSRKHGFENTDCFNINLTQIESLDKLKKTAS